MAIYDVDSINESYSEEDVLDSMLEACDTMMDMLESTATQRHFGVDVKSLKKYSDMNLLHGKLDKVEKSKLVANMAAKRAAKQFHDGTYDKNVDKAIEKHSNQISGYDLSDEELDNINKIAKLGGKAASKAATGYALGRMAAKSGADIKSAYDKAAAKAEKKKAIKETCLNILSVIDEL